MNQFDTPLYDALIDHMRKKPISLHVPGHKYGNVFPKKYTSIFRQVLHIDATELRNLDDLHFPEGVILESERLLAQAYHAKRSYFLVNGSTVGNLAMIMGTIREGDTVFVQRNCHKSILNGIQLVRANPILINPDYEKEWRVAGGVSPATIEEALNLFPECKGIIVTYPNYYGMTFNLKEIIEIAHSHHIPVLVDEAHGAHFIGGSYFPPSALELGADIVVQSAHKTLPAMTMGAYLHVNSQYILPEEIEKYLRILQSSSPSYAIMASLDIARSYIATYSRKDQEYLKNQIDTFKGELCHIPGIRILEYSNRSGDPLKVTIQSTTKQTGYNLQKQFEMNGIFTEMADPSNVLLVLPLLKEGMSFPFYDILEKIRFSLKKSKVSFENSNFKEWEQPSYKRSKITRLHTEKEHGEESETIPISESVGHICAETIIPYPPGVPILFMGERITEEDVESLLLYLNGGAHFQGGKNLADHKITVFRYTELGDHHE